MLIDCLSSRDEGLEAEYNAKKAEFLSPDSELMKTNNRQTTIRSIHTSFREWIYQCLNHISNPKIMDLAAWGASPGQKLLVPSVDSSGTAIVFEAFPQYPRDNNLIPPTLKRFITWEFIFFNPAKHKISKDEVIVPESDMKLENAFGPLFFDFLWNGLFMRGCKFKIIMDFLLLVSTRDVMSMNYLQKYITADGKQTESEIYILSAEILATLAWMCDAAAADNEEVVRTNSGQGRKDHLEFFLKASPGEQSPYEFLFQKKLGEFLANKKRSSRGVEVGVDDCVMMEQPRFRPPSLKPSKRVSQRVFAFRHIHVCAHMLCNSLRRLFAHM